MARIPDSFLDDLLARTDIVELIEARVPLKRAGREYQARCPFHDERTPSFTVSPNKQFYHCFGCGAHGTALKFLMEYDGLEFLDAVEELAQRAGMTVPRETRAREESGFQDLYAALDAATKFYQRQLTGNQRAQEYLSKRGVDGDIVERFLIGYAPDAWDGVKNALGSDPRRFDLLDKAGLIASGDKGARYDRFRDRVMFPIRDRRGRVIAYGGRVLEGDGPKYLNSPETALFHKGRELYALYEARQANSKLARLVVVEGYMDVVSLHQHGVTQAVATLGTATTKDHAELLFRNSADVYFCFDGDKAGRSAAWRAVESVLPRMRDGRQAFFVFLPEGEDPDTIVRKEGVAGFEQRLAAAQPLSEFFFAHQEADTNLATADGRARLVERCRALIEGIPDGAFRDRMVEMLAEKTALKWTLSAGLPASVEEKSREIMDARLATLRGERGAGGGMPVRAERGAGDSGARRSVVRTMVALLVQQPALVRELEPPYLFGVLRQPGVPLLMELIAACRERSDMTTGVLLERFEGHEQKAALRKLAMMEFPAAPELWHAEFRDAAEQLNRQTVQQRVDDLLALQAERALSEAEKTELRESLAAKSKR
jgi:DNA primase